MSEGIEARLRHEALTAPSTVTKVYPGDVIEVIDALRKDLAAAEAEIEKLRQQVAIAVHQGIAGATRAWSDKVDEANLLRDVASIERDGALAECEALRQQLFDANAKPAESNVILRAFAEAERLEDIALSSQGEPDARKKWAAWQAQRAIASEVLRAWQKRNPQSA